MKAKLLIFLLILGSVARAQGDFTSLLATSTAVDLAKAPSDQLQSFLGKIAASNQNDVRRLHTIFKRSHSVFLKKYKAYSDFDEMFSKGEYDCLTATALLSNVLENFQYTYNIIETNYHIFLMVQTEQGEIMIETTDRFGGFITNKAEIAERISRYKKYIPTANPSSGYLYQYSFSLFQKISKENLNGLLYFNQAVKAYNRREWVTCSLLLEKSHSLYASPRCDALGSILIQSISASRMDEKIKADCMARLKNFWTKKSDMIASN